MRAVFRDLTKGRQNHIRPRFSPDVSIYGLGDLGSLSFPTCKMGGVMLEQGLLKGIKVYGRNLGFP